MGTAAGTCWSAIRAQPVAAVDALFVGPTGISTHVLARLAPRTSTDDYGASIAVGLHFQDDEDEFPVTGIDVWIGAPGRTVTGYVGAGAVDHYFLNKSHQLDYVDTVTAASASVRSQVQTDAHFGSVLAPVVNVQGGGVLIGTPDQSVNGQAGAGAVTYVATQNLTLGTPTISGGSTATQDQAGVEGTAEAGDHFGASIVYSPYGLFPVVVGVPGEDVGTITDAGMINGLQIGGHDTLVYDDAGREFPGGGLSQNSSGVPGTRRGRRPVRRRAGLDGRGLPRQQRCESKPDHHLGR